MAEVKNSGEFAEIINGSSIRDIQHQISVLANDRDDMVKLIDSNFVRGLSREAASIVYEGLNENSNGKQFLDDNRDLNNALKKKISDYILELAGMLGAEHEVNSRAIRLAPRSIKPNSSDLARTGMQLGVAD